MTNDKKPAFPCNALPDEPAATRLLGLYPQRRKGLWMQRIKVPGGVLNPKQWSALAAMCRRYTPSASLHCTTRQDIEFHDLSPENIPLLQTDIAHTGLTGAGACGDTLRNITCCPGNGLCSGTPDLSETAAVVQKTLEAYEGIYDLPRKFKISFSACPKACAQPWINDLGFVARTKDGCSTLDVVGAGSLGARPLTGITLLKNLPIEQAAALALSAVRLFFLHGNRKNRAKARLRHLREDQGDACFVSDLQEQFELSQHLALPIPSAPQPHRSTSFVTRLQAHCGELTPQDAEAIADLISRHAVSVRIENHHRLSVFSSRPKEALTAISAHPVLSPLEKGPDIASCPGTAFCKHALVDTRSVEKRLRENMSSSETRAVRISGCPNGCAHSAVADIGLTGRIRKDKSGTRCEGFHVAVGGGMGKTPAMAKALPDFFPASEIDGMIRDI